MQPSLRSPADVSAGTLALIIAPIAFTVVWVVLGLVSDGYDLWDLHIAPYSVISQPISGLGMGATAPYMNAVFVLYGLAMIWGAVAFSRALPTGDRRAARRIAALLSVHGMGAVIVGLFDLEAIMLHLAGFLLVISPILTFPVIAHWLRDLPGWQQPARVLRVGAVVTLLLTVVYFATFDPEAAGENTGVAGLAQRILVLQLCGWFVWLGVRTRRARPATDSRSRVDRDEPTARP